MFGEDLKYNSGRDKKFNKEVSNRIFIPVFQAAKERGIAFRDLLIGVPYEESYFLNKRERVEWWVYCKILSNMRTMFSYKDFENIGADFIRGGTYIEGLIGFFLLTSKKISKISSGAVLKRITSNILCSNTQLEFIGNNKMRFTIRVEKGYEHPPEFAYGNKGIIHELGNRIGLKNCTVYMQFIPHGAFYDMSWERESILFKLKRAVRWLFNINKAFGELTDTHEELLKEYEKLEDYKNNLETKVDERTSELKKAHEQLSETIVLLKQAQQAQNHFFTNISHEFRTPLTLILGPVKQMIESENNEKNKNDLKVVYRNANNLLRLVNQLLDLSKLESGNMQLQTVCRNIMPVLKSITESFYPYAERKGIELKLNSQQDNLILYLDKDKIEKIISNVLSNACNFTPRGGQIEVKVIKNKKFACIIIRDTGIGIANEKIPRIFDRFYQVNGGVTREHQGTGIGLALTKELVELHKGKIEVESEEGKGTTCTIYIPLGKEHLKPEEINETESGEENITLSVKENFYREDISGNNKSTEVKIKTGMLADKSEKSLLLIIDDNPDVRNYIKNKLCIDFRIIEAADGEEGWKNSVDQIPDLIISDVMMPKMDGFKLCDKLKKDERTSHIPIILLTAKASSKDKVEGFETGADEYIMKPFEMEELKARILNLIEQRKRIHEHFRRHGLFEIEETNINPVDKKFIENTMKYINEHISDCSFGVENLAKDMAVSRSLLLKKTVFLVGDPPIELIKRTRLNKAAKLIENKFGNISEIALEVGFNNPSYFAECFKKQFGVNPSQYKNRSI